MNDHNLDDLIIPNIEPKTSKAKSILTIIALLIVVLIVAIILTSVVLDDKTENKALLEENDTEMVSPELTLANVGKVKEPKAEPKLNEIIEEELNKPVKSQKTPVTLDSKPVKVVETEVPAPTTPEPEVVKTPIPVVETKPEPETKSVVIDNNYEQTPEPIEVPKAETPKVEVPKVVAPVVAPAVVTKKPVKSTPVKAVNNAYYIQVGAYKASPSKQLLRSIKNSGFHYTITAPNAKGTKKLLIGPYQDRPSANVALVRVKDRINKSAFVTKKR